MRKETWIDMSKMILDVLVQYKLFDEPADGWNNFTFQPEEVQKYAELSTDRERNEFLERLYDECIGC